MAISAAQGGATSQQQSPPQPPTTYDPGYQKGQSILIYVSRLDEVIETETGTVNWSKVETDGEGSLAWSKAVMMNEINKSQGSGHTSKAAKDILADGVKVSAVPSLPRNLFIFSYNGSFATTSTP